MKINPYGNIQNIYRKSIEKQQPKGDVSKKRDQLEISTTAKLMQQETRIATERKEKVEALKAKIDSGEYKVNAQDVAKKFYEFWNE
ncbi:MAG: flagellar biosynthesis anti-sigma factor FlgM [Anaerobacillus sp.]|jgi:negative regulator of flagellin synthesis FlgM|uniref:flagellar biosynthesis anti-sigma factor FlgM n=1 Tax=Anaerobacillus sp. TaxID=1872506 RepID=UPI00391873A1